MPGSRRSSICSPMNIRRTSSPVGWSGQGSSRRCSTCRQATGPRRSAAWRPCPAARRTSSSPSIGRWHMPSRCAAQSCMPWPASWRPTPIGRWLGGPISPICAMALRAAEAGITLLIEPINTRDIPGYFLNRPSEARRIIEEVGAPNLELQFDVYHCQIMVGDLATQIRTHADITGHIQIAGVPERHEPDVGEINYPYLFEVIDQTGYEGWIGCEYRPKAETADGLSWLKPWL